MPSREELEEEMNSPETSTLDRLRSNLPVTVGALLTAGALGYGLKAMGSGGTGAQQNAGMSARVGLQAATLATIVGWSVYMHYNKPESEMAQRRVLEPAHHRQ